MRKNDLLTVIHCHSEDQAVSNAKVAFDNGADGIFLINHGIPAQELESIYYSVRMELGQEKFVGLNFLDLRPLQASKALAHIEEVSGLWMDDVGYKERDENYMSRLEVPRRVRSTLFHNRGFNGLLFGGVDFKGQEPAHDLTEVTALMAHFMDVVTTSGPATGSPPALEKIKIMRSVLPQSKLAVASGMTPENVDPFLELVDYFLVATGISQDFHNLHSKRVRQMADKMQK